MEIRACSWMGKLNIVKVSVFFSGLIHKLNSITVKFPVGVFTELDKLISKFTCERKCRGIAETTLKGRTMGRETRFTTHQNILHISRKGSRVLECYSEEVTMGRAEIQANQDGQGP